MNLKKKNMLNIQIYADINHHKACSKVDKKNSPGLKLKRKKKII